MNFKQQLTETNNKNLFLKHNNIFATGLNENQAIIKLNVIPESYNAMGGIHGGILFAMADSVTGLVARVYGDKFVTLNSNFRYLRDGRTAKTLVGKGMLIKRGKKITVVRDVIIREDSGELLAEGEFTYFCIACI